MSPRKSVVAFFVVALVFTAVCQTPGILALRAGTYPPPPFLLLMAIGSAGPTLVALALSAWVGGRAGVGALFRRRGHPGAALYPIALGHVMAAHLIGSAVLFAAGLYTAHHLIYPPLQAEQVAIAIVAPLGEEYGWRGYAQPRLQAVMSPLWASLIVGVVWQLWHVPSFFMPGIPIADMLRTLPMMLAGAVIYGWLYNASGGNMPILLLAHLGAHLDNVFRAEALDGYAPLYSTSVVLVLFAIALVATGRLKRETAVTLDPLRGQR